MLDRAFWLTYTLYLRYVKRRSFTRQGLMPWWVERGGGKAHVEPPNTYGDRRRQVKGRWI